MPIRSGGCRDLRCAPSHLLAGTGRALHRALVSGRPPRLPLERGHGARQRGALAAGLAGAALPGRPGFATDAAYPDGDPAFELGPIAGGSGATVRGDGQAAADPLAAGARGPRAGRSTGGGAEHRASAGRGRGTRPQRLGDPRLYGAERQRAAPEREVAPADISQADLLVAFDPLLGPGSPAPKDLFGYLRDRAGLLIARDEGTYAFPTAPFRSTWRPVTWRTGRSLPSGCRRWSVLIRCGGARCVCSGSARPGRAGWAQRSTLWEPCCLMRGGHGRAVCGAVAGRRPGGQALVELRLREKSQGRSTTKPCSSASGAGWCIGRGRSPGATRAGRGRRCAGATGRSALRSGVLLPALPLPRATRTAVWVCGDSGRAVCDGQPPR